MGWIEREIEERSKNIWNTIVDPRDDELLRLKNVVNDLRERQHQVLVSVNNQFEDSAPRMIEKIKVLL
jgi:hypothetical protein